MRRKRQLLGRLLIASLLCLHAGNSNADMRSIRVGLFDMPPFYSQDALGRPQGELVTRLNQVMRHLGINWEAKFMPVPQALREVVHGDIDMLMVIQHPLLQGKTSYSQYPVDTMYLEAYHSKQHPSVSSIAALRNQRVALLRGYGYGGLLNQLLAPDNQLSITIADSHKQAFGLLAENKVDVVINYRRPSEQALSELQLNDVVASPIQSSEIFFAVSEKSGQNLQLVKALDQAILELKGAQFKKQTREQL